MYKSDIQDYMKIGAMWVAAMVMSIVVVTDAFAADVTTEVHGPNGYIIYSGQTEAGDFDKVVDAWLLLSDDKRVTNPITIVLQGPGGLAEEGEAIGEFVRDAEMNTWVMSGSRCASACTSIWLAGKDRVLFEGGELMFHVPYITANSALDVHPMENVKNNFGWDTALSFYVGFVVEAIAYDLGMGIRDAFTFVSEMAKTSPSVFYVVDTQEELEQVLGGYWVPAK